MERYSNRSGNSPITYYEAGSNFITVWFEKGKAYRYSYAKAGSYHVEQMKILAVAGSGLCAYITHNVKYKYD